MIKRLVIQIAASSVHISKGPCARHWNSQNSATRRCTRDWIHIGLFSAFKALHVELIIHLHHTHTGSGKLCSHKCPGADRREPGSPSVPLTTIQSPQHPTSCPRTRPKGMERNLNQQPQNVSFKPALPSELQLPLKCMKVCE